MRKIILLGVFCLLTSASILAQTSLPPVYEIKTDTVTIQRIDSIYFQRLEDKVGKWTIDDVNKPPLSDKFHQKGTKADGIDTNAIHIYWHRYRLKNVMLCLRFINIFTFKF